MIHGYEFINFGEHDFASNEPIGNVRIVDAVGEFFSQDICEAHIFMQLESHPEQLVCRNFCSAEFASFLADMAEPVLYAQYIFRKEHGSEMQELQPPALVQIKVKDLNEYHRVTSVLMLFRCRECDWDELRVHYTGDLEFMLKAIPHYMEGLYGSEMEIRNRIEGGQ